MGLDAFAPLLACISVYCVAACGGNACGSCLAANCPNDVADEGTAAGWLLDDCVIPCNGDVSCVTACENAFPQDKAAFDATNACAIAHCQAQCQ
jgi:hypothetical protein